MSGTTGIGAINVPGYPSTWRVPGVYVGVDPSNANSGQQTYATLIIGQAGAATPAALLNECVLSVGPTNAATIYGGNSPIAQMVAAYRLRDPTGTLYELPIPNSGSGTTPASGSILVAGTASGAGTLFLMIGGQLVQVAVNNDDTAATIMSNISAAITQVATTLLVTPGAIGAGGLTLNATFSGATGNDIDLRINYLGAAGGQVTPAGITVTITPMSGGTGEIPLAAALANLPQTVFNLIAMQQNDATSMATLASFLSDVSGRWNAIGQLFGHGVYYVNGSPGQLAAVGTVPNDQHKSIAGLQLSPTPSFVAAANLAGCMLSSQQEDVSLPYNTLETDILPPAAAYQFTASERNTLLYDGISTFSIESGTVSIERVITTYRLNASGQIDTSYLNAERMSQLVYWIQDQKANLSSLFGRAKLISDASRIASAYGQTIASGPIIGQAITSRNTYLEDNFGLVQNSGDFASSLLVNVVNGTAFVRAMPAFADQLEAIAIDLAFTP